MCQAAKRKCLSIQKPYGRKTAEICASCPLRGMVSFEVSLRCLVQNANILQLYLIQEFQSTLKYFHKSVMKRSLEFIMLLCIIYIYSSSKDTTP